MKKITLKRLTLLFLCLIIIGSIYAYNYGLPGVRTVHTEVSGTVEGEVKLLFEILHDGGTPITSFEVYFREEKGNRFKLIQRAPAQKLLGNGDYICITVRNLTELDAGMYRLHAINLVGAGHDKDVKVTVDPKMF